MILTISTASCTGFCFQADLTPEQEREAKVSVQAYNTLEAWRARGSDGTATLATEAAAIAEHNDGADERDRVTDAAGLLAWYADTDDGTGSQVEGAELVQIATEGPWPED